MIKASKIVALEGDHRIVLTAGERYVIEKNDGNDAMGAPRWMPTGEQLGAMQSRHDDDEHSVNVPPGMFRFLMRLAIKAGESQ